MKADSKAHRYSKQSNSGYTLIEVMIALFVLSIGMLGMVNLQVMSLRDTISALNRTRAVLLSNDLAERIIANKRGIDDYAVGSFGSIPTSEPSPACAGSGAAQCTPAEMAQYDLWQWRTLMENSSSGLPDGTATTTVAGTNLKTVTVTIQWQDQGDTAQYVASYAIANNI